MEHEIIHTMDDEYTISYEIEKVILQKYSYKELVTHLEFLLNVYKNILVKYRAFDPDIIIKNIEWLYNINKEILAEELIEKLKNDLESKIEEIENLNSVQDTSFIDSLKDTLDATA